MAAKCSHLSYQVRRIHGRMIAAATQLTKSCQMTCTSYESQVLQDVSTDLQVPAGIPLATSSLRTSEASMKLLKGNLFYRILS